MKIIIAVVLTVLLVFVLTFLFAAMKINGNGTSKFEEDIELKIVGSTEANSLEGKISNESPVGKALMGAHTGDVVEVEMPAGIMKYKVLEIQRNV